MIPVNEKELLHEAHIDISMYNSDGVLYPSAYQKLTVNMIEEHLDALGIGEKLLMEQYGISWVLLSDCIELRRKIEPSDKLTARTWNSGGKAPYFRRDFAFYDAGGETVAVGATLSTLFVTETRRICTDREKLALIALPAGEELLEVPRRFTCAADFVPVEERVVRPSMTDGIGHVNNTRYGDFVYDAMSDDERAALRGIHRIDVFFMAELRAGDRFAVERAQTPDGAAFRGVILPDGKQSFAMKVQY